MRGTLRALAAYSQSRSGSRKGQRMGFPRRKRKGRCRDSFRLRNRDLGRVPAPRATGEE